MSKRGFDDMVAGGDIASDPDVKPSIPNDEDQCDIDKVEPYDASVKEILPHSPVYTEDFEKLEKGMADLIWLLAKPIQDAKFRNGVVNGLLDEISDRIKRRSREDVRVALIGGMKAGKSAVINSLLSIGMIARQGDAGGSCTWVVQEFCRTLAKQTMPFAAEIQFFNQEDRQSILRSLLADFYHATPNDDDHFDGPKDSDQVAEDFTTQQTTIAVFRALFSDKKQFRNKTAAYDFLSEAECEDDDAILSQLYHWTEELVSSRTKDGEVTHQASTTQTLLWDIAPYLYTVEERDGEPITSLWPFVSHIKFGLDNKLLKHGITLVDLPGLSDANKVRVSNAINQLRNCTHYMIVAEIGRASDDRFIRDHMSRGYFTRGPGRTMLVLTHADSIDEATAVSGTPKEMKEIASLQQKVCELDEQRSQVMAKIRSTKPPQKYVHMCERDEIDAAMRQAQAQEQELRIHLRSKFVAKGMKELYAELTPDPVPLPVFCVGNAAYKKHQAGFSTADPNPPTLTVVGTNIPRLREHLFLAPADGKSNDMQHTVVTQLPILLSSFRLYVSKTHMARKDEIRAIVVEPQHILPEVIDQLFDRMMEDAEKHVLGPLMLEEHEWTMEAAKLCKLWVKQWSTSVHLNMLKKEGVRKNGKNGQTISWNEELLAIKAVEMQDYFRDLNRAWEGYGNMIIKEMTRLVTKMSNRIRACDRVDGDQGFQKRNKAFQVSLRSRPGADYLVLIESSAAEMNTMNESPDNHLVKAMVPVYKHAALIKGRAGTPKKRCVEFQRQVSARSNVWAKTCDGVRAEFKSYLDEDRKELKMQMQKYFAGIDRKFNVLCSDAKAEEPAETELRGKLQHNVAQADKKLVNDVLPRLETCFGKTASDMLLREIYS
ncbi:hypothetical protein D0867_12217 [Hortaea werneckii]|uniref:Dynamin N-terminal domain-containing protein n=1 Tax=Hortaea werneckii TaxID=91943 RepID=A0A3M6Y7U9_HORWE|nr:hypothetical protein D0867_12217 [Hortaea werneckii]